MGLYAQTAVGELKLAGVLSFAVGHVLGLGGDDGTNGYELSRHQVRLVILTMKYMVVGNLGKPTDIVSIYLDASIDDSTRGWYHGHLLAAPAKIALLEKWLLTEEDSMYFG